MELERWEEAPRMRAEPRREREARAAGEGGEGCARDGRAGRGWGGRGWKLFGGPDTDSSRPVTMREVLLGSFERRVSC